jgi:hypothetical protein
MSERYAGAFRFSSRLLAAASVGWCAYAAWIIWVTPYSGSRSFSDVSHSGPLPLIVPLAIAAVGVVAAWTNRPIALLVSALVMLAYAVVTGFSIGGMYQPAVVALTFSTGLLWIARVLSHRRAATASTGTRRRS